MLDAVWLIPALPLAGFLILLATGRRLGDPRAGYVATGAIAASFLVTLLVFLDLLGHQGEERTFTKTLFTWVPAGGLEVNAGFLVDQLSITMALFVTGVGSLIHLYSIGYMHGDAKYPTFFVYLNLFAFSMLMLVLGDNFLITFLGWEGVGACSYFLISFWFDRPTAATAGPKAFITNRVGDFGFMLAMFLIFTATGSLAYTTVFAEAETLTRTTATAISLLLFVGACGKSAQLPLYVWLPDAMEGPTPVSALIHAATMVTAGVFLMCRVNPILDLAPTALTVVAVVGAVTALFAATIACAQNDIKKVLAYSTISQLGYMFLAVGSGAYVAAIFHMVTHAFFKALLFLGAGSVIHGLHDEQDMTRMGGLRNWMKVTYATFIVGWLSIAGVPPFSGFWSKDEILAFAWEKSPVLWAIGLFTALLTAYYMSRQVFLVFFGDERWEKAAPAHAAGHHAAGHHGDSNPHESPATMRIPLIVLAVLAAFGGLLSLPFAGYKLEHFLEPVFGERLHHLTLSSGSKLVLALVAIAAGLIGIGIAALIYLKKRLRPIEPEILQRAWYVDDLYSQVIGEGGRAAADLAAAFDANVVDGAVNGTATAVRATGSRLRTIQTGYVRNYALAVGAGAVGILAFVVSRS
ncbi:MAG: NADH-quinone oxidoreductase subunit L [Acidimicrobiales bacterium]